MFFINAEVTHSVCLEIIFPLFSVCACGFDSTTLVVGKRREELTIFGRRGGAGLGRGLRDKVGPIDEKMMKTWFIYKYPIDSVHQTSL